jgi:transposase
LVPPGDDDHDCGWKTYAKAQDAKLAEQGAKLDEITSQLAVLQRRLLGKSSERRKGKKIPPPLPPKTTATETARKRADALELRGAKLETEVVPISVPPDKCSCPECGNAELRRVGAGKPSTVYEYVQPHFRRRIYRRETLSCRCGHIVTAPAPDRVGEKTRYAASFIAHLIVSKCSESTPERSPRPSRRRGAAPAPHRRARTCPGRCRRPCRRDEYAAARSRRPVLHLELRHARARRLHVRAESKR